MWFIENFYLIFLSSNFTFIFSKIFINFYFYLFVIKQTLSYSYIYITKREEREREREREREKEKEKNEERNRKEMIVRNIVSIIFYACAHVYVCVVY